MKHYKHKLKLEGMLKPGTLLAKMNAKRQEMESKPKKVIVKAKLPYLKHK